MRKLFLLLFLFWASLCLSQTTAVTLHVTDGDGQQWFNGSWTIQLGVPPGQTVPNKFLLAGTTTPVPNQQQSGGLDGTGSAAFTLTPNLSIVPSGTIWTLNVCPAATSQCFAQTITAAGASQTTNITPPAIRINAQTPQPRITAYQDIEVTGGLLGSEYFNITSTIQRVCVTIPCGWASFGGTGTVSNVSTGNLNPIFNASISNPSTIPNLSFTLLNAPANQVFGNCTGVLALPSYCTITAAMIPGGVGGWTGTMNATNFPKVSVGGTNQTLSNSAMVEFLTTNNAPNDATPRFEQTRNADNFAWTQFPVAPATIAIGSNTVSITCVYGIESTLTPYFVDIGTTGTAEYAPVTATTCTNATAGSAGTITLIATNTHAAGYSVGSATVGAQEAINDGLETSTNQHDVHVVIPCDPNGANINWDAPLYTHGNHVWIEGNGCARIHQTHVQQGIVLGNDNPGSGFFFNRVHGLGFQGGFAGTQPQINHISSLSRTGCPGACVVTINFAANHDFLVRQWIFLLGNLNDNTFAGQYQVTTVNSATQITATPLVNANNNPTTVYAGGVAVVDYTAIEDKLNIDGYIDQVSIISTNGVTRPYFFGITAFNDQAMNVLQFSNSGSDASFFKSPDDSFMSQMIYAPGPNNPNGAVAFIYGLNCSMQLSGDCVDWTSGDDLYMTDSVLEGFVRKGVRMSLRRGGFGDFVSKGVHYEGTGATPPGITAIGWAGIVSDGASIVNYGGAGNTSPTGNMTFFGTVGNGLLTWTYFVQPIANTADPMCTTQPPDGVTGVTNAQRCATSWGTGPILFVGSAHVDSVTGGTIAPSWPAIPGATSYKLLRLSNNGSQQPFGSGNYLIATVNPLTSCTDTVCTVTDSVGLTPAAYTVPTYQVGSYFPYLPHWGCAVVLANLQDAGNGGNVTPGHQSYTGTLSTGGFCAASIGLAGQNDFSLSGPTSFSGNSNGSMIHFTALSQLMGGNAVGQGFANLMPAKIAPPGLGDGGLQTNIKGLFNFGFYTTFSKPYDIITWEDSNYAKTDATFGHRPPNDSGDCASGMDQNGGYFTRCGTSVSEYINTLPSGTPARRITSTGETLSGPETVGSVTFGTLPASSNGTVLYCSDCNATCTAGGGTGRMCFRENGAWTH